jgi:hypothetical protein
MPPAAACPILESMTARAVQRLEARLDELFRVGWARLATAFAAALLAAPAHGADRGLGLALAAGAFVLAVLATRAFVDRCDLIDSAVADRDALAITAVRERAGRIASRQELARAAETLSRLARTSPSPRHRACRSELLELSDVLTYAQPLEPTAAVECVRFVEGPGSPLYRSGVAEPELRAELRHLLMLLEAGKADPQARVARTIGAR